MDNKWYSVSNIKKSQNYIFSEVSVKSESPWFSGHFPDEPILPGIAQIAMVFDALQQNDNEKFCIKGIKRVRFRQIIRPEDNIEINTSWDEKKSGEYSFKVLVNGDIACTGIILAEKSE